ncbi:hypothetical protein KJ359_007770 [Pestalotiopsis sp. 9143b]|nr:hypothetical protein KJ359_007770 [Pestalotiopsis sp. 9143b]
MVHEAEIKDRKPSVASGHSATSTSAVSAKSKTGSSHSSGSSRKPTGFTIPDPASVEEHGRTYNGYREGKYLLPNDALEQERLDLAHEMWRLLLFGELSWVPFADEPKQVLDIGTGTGIWAIEFAQQHPASHVVGTDLSLIQPPEGSIPSNCTFERDDVEEEWVFDRLFDYIHLRAMLTCFNDHVGVLRKVYDNLQPGGWVEYHDYDPGVFGKDEANQQALIGAPLWEWCQRVFNGAKRFGRDMFIARRYKQLLLDTGFVDVAEKILLAPNKPWPEDPRERRIGQYMQANSLEMIDGVSAKIFQADGMSTEEVESLVSKCRESFQSKELHLYTRMYVVYGRKPREDELPPKTKTQQQQEQQQQQQQGKQEQDETKQVLTDSQYLSHDATKNSTDEAPAASSDREIHPAPRANVSKAVAESMPSATNNSTETSHHSTPATMAQPQLLDGTQAPAIPMPQDQTQEASRPLQPAGLGASSGEEAQATNEPNEEPTANGTKLEGEKHSRGGQTRPGASDGSLAAVHHIDGVTTEPHVKLDDNLQST